MSNINGPPGSKIDVDKSTSSSVVNVDRRKKTKGFSFATCRMFGTSRKPQKKMFGLPDVLNDNNNSNSATDNNNNNDNSATDENDDDEDASPDMF